MPPKAPVNPYTRPSRELIVLPLGASACMPDYSDEELEWLKAVDYFRRTRQLRFPTAVDLLRLAKALGYRLVEAPDQSKISPPRDRRIKHKPRKRNRKLKPREHKNKGPQ